MCSPDTTRCVDVGIETCGANGEWSAPVVCPSPAHASASCDGGSCGFTCDIGYVLSGAICTVMAPRPLAPLSTAMVTSRRPTLRWVLAAGTDGAHVEICADRACTTAIATRDVSGTSVAPSADLPPGMVYWRMLGRAGGDVGVIPSPTWELMVGTRSSSIDTSWGTVLDVDGDGSADVVAGAPLTNGRVGRAHLFQGSSGGLSTTPTLSLTGQNDGLFGWAVASAGDVNGDGFADVIVGAPESDADAGRGSVYLGSAVGLSASPVSDLPGPDGAGGFFGAAVTSAGDVNGDGYADVAVAAPHTASDTGTVYIYLGGPTGLASSPTTSFVGPDGPGGFGDTGALASVGDLNGDGYQISQWVHRVAARDASTCTRGVPAVSQCSHKYSTTPTAPPTIHPASVLRSRAAMLTATATRTSSSPMVRSTSIREVLPDFCRASRRPALGASA